MPGIFELRCPCCDATLEVDGDNETILSHNAPKRHSVPSDLRDAVRQLKSEESSRDERFRKQFEEERGHEGKLEKRFKGLMKKAKSEGPPSRPLRDIDLD